MYNYVATCIIKVLQLSARSENPSNLSSFCALKSADFGWCSGRREMVERRGLQLLRSGNVNIHFIFIGLKRARVQ